MMGYSSGDFDGNSRDGSNTFIIKFDSSGNTIWSKFVRINGGHTVNRISIDSAGNIYIGGVGLIMILMDILIVVKKMPLSSNWIATAIKYGPN